MLTNLSKLNLLVARNNKGPIERNASLQVLLRNQNIPKLNESFTTKDLLSSLSLQKKLLWIAVMILFASCFERISNVLVIAIVFMY